MKVRNIFYIALCSLLLVGCKKTKDEPSEPQSQLAPVITEAQLMSYFPYKTGDQIVFMRWDYQDVIYTVEEATLSKEADGMHLDISMSGVKRFSQTILYYITMSAEVTDKQLKMDFSHRLIGFPETKGSYVYEAGKSDTLPEAITLSNNAVIKKDQGLFYFEDADSEEWYFKERL